MSIEAMWQVTFGAGITATGVEFGAGVVVLETGRLFGGDSWFYYIGTYNVVGEDVTCEISVRRHTPGNASVLGKDNSILILRAKFNQEQMLLVGNDAENPAMQFQASIRRIAELP